jgi:hypothetical protein
MSVFYDWADLWAMGLWRLQGTMSTGPLEDEAWWKEWKTVRAFVENAARHDLERSVPPRTDTDSGDPSATETPTNQDVSE